MGFPGQASFEQAGKPGNLSSRQPFPDPTVRGKGSLFSHQPSGSRGLDPFGSRSEKPVFKMALEVRSAPGPDSVLLLGRPVTIKTTLAGNFEVDFK